MACFSKVSKATQTTKYFKSLRILSVRQIRSHADKKMNSHKLRDVTDPLHSSNHINMGKLRNSQMNFAEIFQCPQNLIFLHLYLC